MQILIKYQWMMKIICLSISHNNRGKKDKQLNIKKAFLKNKKRMNIQARFLLILF